jgi:cysteine desulfuration protein SufE
MTTALPEALEEVVGEFEVAGDEDRLQLLLELADELPELPPRYADHTELLEQVHECQSPLFLAVEHGDDDVVRLFFDAPAEAPTTRAFAAILHTGLDGQRAEAVLAVPDDFYTRLGIMDSVSPLRIRGLAAMLGRIKNNVRAAIPAQ